MSNIAELIRIEDNGMISFGNYLVDSKKKIKDFEVRGDLYNLKTFKEITKLEKNGTLLFEAVPGVAINNFQMDEKTISFNAEGFENTQITMELESSKEYKIIINGENVSSEKTNIAGKLIFSLELSDNPVSAIIEKI